MAASSGDAALCASICVPDPLTLAYRTCKRERDRLVWVSELGAPDLAQLLPSQLPLTFAGPPEQIEPG